MNKLNQIEKELLTWFLGKFPQKTIKKNEDFLRKKYIDSFEFINLILFCEDTYKIKFNKEDMLYKKLSSIKKIALMIANKI